jgi:hypothetical protein
MNIPIKLKSGLKSMDYVSLQETQKQIREYFVKNQNELNIAGILKHSYMNCPDFYALISAVICDLSICDSWVDVYNQYKSSFNSNQTLYDASGNVINTVFTLCDYSDDYDPKNKIVCMCGHNCCPENMSIITNKFTNLNVLIACDCLEKTGIINSYNFKNKIKKNDSYAKILYKKELEKQKMSNRINRWEKFVLKTIELNNDKRKCEECGVLSIAKTEPEWKKKCLSCYRTKPVGVCLLIKEKPYKCKLLKQ